MLVFYNSKAKGEGDIKFRYYDPIYTVLQPMLHFEVFLQYVCYCFINCLKFVLLALHVYVSLCGHYISYYICQLASVLYSSVAGYNFFSGLI